METLQIRLYADAKPIQGIINPGPHQIYCNPFVSLEKSTLKHLKEDEIRVEMIYAGLCGTDIHLIKKDRETGYIKSSAPLIIPDDQGRRIGHEGVGRVLEKGNRVKHVNVGSYVTFESIVVCHYCDVCRKGHFNQCRNARLLGLEEDGLFGNIVNVPAMLAHDITDFIKTEDDLRAMTCVEPAGVAYVACQNTKIKGGDNVIVFGAGPIGIFTAILSKTVFGASTVQIVEPVKFRREFAGQWADNVYDVTQFRENLPENIDVVIEASGEMSNINTIFRSINPNGRVALLARSGAPFKIDAVDHMITNAISIIGSRGHLCGAFSDIMILYQQGRIPLGSIITYVAEGVNALYRLLENPDKIINENCKVLAHLNNDPEITVSS
jgi:threonine dehydrogenase-like Zn-dependent dehydrogenase